MGWVGGAKKGWSGASAQSLQDSLNQPFSCAQTTYRSFFKKTERGRVGTTGGRRGGTGTPNSRGVDL